MNGLQTPAREFAAIRQLLKWGEANAQVNLDLYIWDRTREI